MGIYFLNYQTSTLQMKFLALIAAVAAQVEDGGDCSTGDACAEGSCCGTASLDEDTLTICNVADSDTYSDDTGDWAFACNEDAGGEEEKASGLVLSAIAIMGAV